MNNQYKLIKTYPNSPELNTIVIFNTAINRYLSIKGGLNFNIKTIENNPEFWEKIVETYYEVLSIRSSSKHIFYKNKHNLYLPKKGSYSPGLKGFPLEDVFIPKHGLHIYSVKRLSDGEIFTIGDKVKLDFKSTIKGFEIDKTYVFSGIGVFTDSYIVDDFNNCCLSYIEKDNPAFTTEDGVDIYENTIVHLISTNTYRYIQSIDTFNIETILRNKSIKVFSTKKAATDYIILNKPCLSIKDITQCAALKFQTVEVLKEKVKDKIK